MTRPSLRRVKPAAIVRDQHLDLSRADLEDNIDVPCTGVLCDVVQRFTSDPHQGRPRHRREIRFRPERKTNVSTVPGFVGRGEPKQCLREAARPRIVRPGLGQQSPDFMLAIVGQLQDLGDKPLERVRLARFEELERTRSHEPDGIQGLGHTVVQLARESRAFLPCGELPQVDRSRGL
jgi:hypothetical protein